MIGGRWGVREVETLRSYPCDDFVTAPSLQAWRGVTVAASPDQVWPWVAQIRAAPYSYDWTDNLGRPSPRDLLDLPEPRAGQAFTAVGGRPVGRIVSVESRVQLTGAILGAFMSYVLVPEVSDGQPPTTRLLLKIVMAGRRWLAPAVSAGDLVMARRQLLNLKHLAEKSLR